MASKRYNIYRSTVHWRYAMARPHLLFFDARLIFFIILFAFYIRWWTFIVLVIAIAGEDLLAPGMLDALVPPLDKTMPGAVTAGAFLAFYAFLGFEDMVNIAEEVRDEEALVFVDVFFGVALPRRGRDEDEERGVAMGNLAGEGRRGGGGGGEGRGAFRQRIPSAGGKGTPKYPMSRKGEVKRMTQGRAAESESE